jgi:uncharacterized protein (TIGR01777 family)
MKQNVLISGGTGLVGHELSKLLSSENFNVALLSRRKQVKGYKSFYWDHEKGEIDSKAIDFADIIVHLAGENVSGKKWTKSQKKKIISSRVETTALLRDAIQKTNKKPKAFISASAVGYYGSSTSDHIYKENDEPGKDFLAETVVKWEASVNEIQQMGIPTAALRIGVVMTVKGGALPKIMKPVTMGVGSALGNGKQWIPWISVNDLVRMFLFVMQNTMDSKPGSKFEVYNAACPTHITNFQLSKELAKIFKKPFFMPAVPAFVIKMLFGEMATIVLNGSRVSSEKIQNAGFVFKDTQVEDIFY